MRPRCTQCQHRAATLTARSMGGPEHLTCTRCAGTVILAVGGHNGAIIRRLPAAIRAHWGNGRG